MPTNLASRGEIRVSVSNDQTTIHSGPITKRVGVGGCHALRTDGTSEHPRQQGAREQTRMAICFETGQLMGEMGAAENP